MGGILDPLRAVVVEASIGIRLSGVFTAAIGEDHSIGDNRRLRLVHVARHPDWRQLGITVLGFHFERHHCAMRHRAVGNRGVEVWMRRPPERSQRPTRALEVFPTCHAAPDSGGLEVRLLIAQQRSAIDGCLMVCTTGRLCVEQVDAAFLAAGDHQLTVRIVEDRRSDLHIEITFLHPNPIGGYIPVFEFQLVTFNPRAYKTVAINVVVGIISTVPGGSPGSPARVDRRAGPSPQAAAAGIKRHHLLLWIVDVDGPYLVWISGAALRRSRKQHVAPEVQRIRFAVGISKLKRRRHVFAIGYVEGMNLAITGEGVNRSSAGVAGRTDNRSCRLSWRTQGIAGSSSSVRRGVFEMLLPKHLAGFHVDRVDVVGDASFDGDLFGTAAGVHLIDNQRREERVHLLRRII